MSGIAGVYSINRKFTGNDLIEWLYSAEIFNQPRGETGAGVSVADQWGEIKTEKDLGMVRQAISIDTLKKMSNPSVHTAIGHTRYAREQHPSIANTQPIEIGTEHYKAVVAADSKIAGWHEINTWFEYQPRETQTGAEVLGRLFLNELENANGNFKEAGEKFFYRMKGKGFYSAMMLIKEKDRKDVKLVAIRDPHAGLPFHFVEKNGTVFLGSGTYPMEHAGIDLEDIKEVPQGSIVLISDNGTDIKEYDKDKKTTCVFERVYFGCPYDRVSTELGPRFYELFDKHYKTLEINPDLKKAPSNYIIRNILGACQAERHPELANEVDIWIPIVYTGTGVTYGLAKVTGIPLAPDALFKTGAPRTFQISDPELRRIEVDLKNAGITEFIKGKRNGSGDDSVVKGGVGGYYSKKKGVIGLFEHLGAESFHMVISYSSMPFPCIRGLVPYHLREKMAAEGLYWLPKEEQEKIVGSKLSNGINIPVKLYYQDNKDMYNIFGSDHCFACMDGIYPLDEQYIYDWVKVQRDISYMHANKKWV